MESLARISSLVESARDLTIDAAQAARSSRGSGKPLDRAQIKKLLDSRNEREVLDGLRRVIAMAYRAPDKTLPLFSSVVKNVASPSLEVRKLVYIYLLRYAEAEPDLALLSINTIQKSLSDPDARVRALALRTMSGIRVPVISQIVSLAIRRGVADMSPLVRRAAALAVPKCYRLDAAQLPALVDHVRALLADRQYVVAGAAIAAFEQLCPDRIELIHPVYRALVRRIVDMDEWSQLAALRVLTRYALRCFPRRKERGGTRRRQQQKDREGEQRKEEGEGEGGEEEEEQRDPDLDLFLTGIGPLLQSRNSAVVVAVTRSYAALGGAEHLSQAAGPLVALLRGPADAQEVALHNIVAVCLFRPMLFVPYAARFLVRAADRPAVWELKFEVLTLVFAHAPARTRSLILHELEHFSRGSGGPALVREAVRAIGRCARSAGADRATAARCRRLLLGQIGSLDGTLAGESLTVIRHLIQLDPARHVGTVVRLARNLDSATDPRARATIVWLVGEFSGLGGRDSVAPDVLRILLRDFAAEPEPVRLQIVLLAAKVYLHHVNARGGDEDGSEGGGGEGGGDGDGIIPRLWDHVMRLVRYDGSYDVRDRARTYRALLAVPQLATLVLLAPKPPPSAESPSKARSGLTLGSATLMLAGGGVHGIKGYEALPDRVQVGQEPDPRLRGEGTEKGAEKWAETRGGGGGGGGGPGRGDSAGGGGARVNRGAGDDGEAMGGSGAGEGSGGRRAGGTGVGTKSLDDWLAEGEEKREEREEDEEDEDEDEDEDGDGEEGEEESEDEEDEEESGGDGDGDEEDEDEVEDEDGGEEGEEGEGDRLIKAG